jgi:phytoene dehydrogenase-like protein
LIVKAVGIPVSNYDTIVIGGGHNGLICATMLARVGQRVLLLEANDKLGGLAADREFAPGFHAPVAQTLYGLPKTVVKDLRLADYGFEAGDDPLPLLALSTDEAPITIGDEALSGAGDADTSAYAGYRQQLKTFAAALAPFWGKTMPRIGMGSLKDLMTFGHMGLKLRLLGRDDMLEFFRVATLPMRDLVDERFESESLRAALCWDGMIGTKMAPRSPNQAVLTLLNRMAGSHDGQHLIPRGGMPAFIRALENAARAAGVVIETSAPVSHVIVEGDENGQRCSGVTLADGKALTATPCGIQRGSKNDIPQAGRRSAAGDRIQQPYPTPARRRLCRKAESGTDRRLPAFTGVDRPDGRMILAEEHGCHRICLRQRQAR